MALTAHSTHRAQLEAERDALRGELAELGALDYDAGFADSSQVNAERGETGALVARLAALLGDVEHALARLDGAAEPPYGRCERCGEEVAPARLEAMPAARRCVACAAAG